MKKTKKTQIGKKPVAAAAVVEEPVAAAPVKEPAAPVAEEPVVPAVEKAAPVVEKPAAAPAAKEPEPAQAEPAPAAAPEKKPARRARKPKAEPAEKATKRVQKPKAEKEEKPDASLLRRSKLDIPAALGLYVQYQGGEVDMAAIAETAKAQFKAANKRGRIASLKIYVKPEEHAAYYVINEDFQGRIDI